MRICCNSCGVAVSTEVPDGTLIRGWVECTECIEKEVILEELETAYDKSMPPGDLPLVSSATRQTPRKKDN